MHLVHWNYFFVAVRGLLNGTYTTMFWDFTTLAYRCSTCCLGSVAIYPYWHVYDSLIDKWTSSCWSCGRTCSNGIVNFSLQKFDVFLIWDSCLSQFLLILTVIIEHIELSHWVNTFKSNLGRHRSWWNKLLHGHMPSHLSSETCRLWSWRECLIIK